jgi:hypothetical protein
LVKLKMPSSAWRRIKARAALADQPVSHYAAQLLVDLALDLAAAKE